MSDTVQFGLDNGVIAAAYEGCSGTTYLGVGHTRAEALRSLADSLDPHVVE